MVYRRWLQYGHWPGIRDCNPFTGCPDGSCCSQWGVPLPTDHYPSYHGCRWEHCWAFWARCAEFCHRGSTMAWCSSWRHEIGESRRRYRYIVLWVVRWVWYYNSRKNRYRWILWQYCYPPRLVYRRRDITYAFLVCWLRTIWKSRNSCGSLYF